MPSPPSQPTPYHHELHTALHAVSLASALTRLVLAASPLHRRRASQLSKPDASPVTVADFAAQALLIGTVHAAFPSDAIVGEEDAGALRADAALAAQVRDLLRACAPPGGLGWLPDTAEGLCDLIDLGGKGKGGRGRFWVLDPIDGTAAFVRGEQYAVSLGLVVGGEEVVGVLGCPNLGVPAERKGWRVREGDVDVQGGGVVLFAERGQGAYMRRMGRVGGEMSAPERVERRRDGEGVRLEGVHFVDSSLSAATSSERVWDLARRMGARFPGTDIYSSHMRYAALVLSGRECAQVRFPVTRKPPWCIWDHAGSQLIYTESGAGVITDLRGRPVDFGRGRDLVGNWGLIAADASVHGKILELVTGMLEESGEQVASPVNAKGLDRC